MVSVPEFLWYTKQLLLGCKNNYSYGKKTTVIRVQKQLLLGYKNSYFYDVRTTVLVM